MVFFTCSHCGVSLKKNQVEKHVNVQCRNCQVLSCMDCGKDFWGDDYKAHIKCITEEEKYSGKDFKPRPGANKGERKQEEWIQKLQEIARTANTAPELKNLLNQLVTFNNVPRKKSKFQKFLQNSVKVPFKYIDQAWELFSQANDSPTQDSSPSKQNNHLSDKTNQMEQEQTNEEVQEETENGETHSKKKKKDKKKKRDKVEDENVDTNNASLELGVNDVSSKKKKHKHKKKNDETDIIVDVETIEEEPKEDEANETTEKNKKKKKKKKSKETEENADANIGEQADSTKDVNGVDTIVPKSKKKKSKNNEIDPCNLEAEEVSQSKKKKRKQEKKEEEEASEPQENGLSPKKKKKEEQEESMDLSQDAGDVTNQGKKLKVEKLISAVLQQTPEKEMSMKKLKKKVLAEFNSSPLNKDGMDESSLLAKIEKKISSKQNKYQLTNDRVKLI